MDSAFANELMRFLLLKLNGDKNREGLHTALRKCQTFEKYREMVGQITAYEDVVERMQEIARKMNEPTGA